MNLDEAFDLAVQVIDETGLADEGWTFEFDNAERRFGACHYRTKRITLSASITELNERDKVLECILHEVAHAKAGHEAAHGYTWVVEARKLGINGDRCYSTDEVDTRLPLWAGNCPSCGLVTARVWRLSRQQRNAACSPCCREYNNGNYTNRYQLQWTRTDGR